MLSSILAVSCFINTEPPRTTSFEIEVRLMFLCGNVKNLLELEADLIKLRDRAKRYPQQAEYYQSLIMRLVTLKQRLHRQIRSDTIHLIDILSRHVKGYLQRLGEQSKEVKPLKGKECE